jgi:aryl-alcohol dehydrogenase-like predicted oxidoreductase
MRTRTLGQDLHVSAIGYGCMGLSQSYLPVPTRAEGIALIRDGIPRFAVGARAANQDMVDLLTRIAKRLDATPAQVALGWLLAQEPWIVPIPGTRKLARLEENLAAADLELTANDLEEIETASAAITVQGARYPEALERLIDR